MKSKFLLLVVISIYPLCLFNYAEPAEKSGQTSVPDALLKSEIYKWPITYDYVGSFGGFGSVLGYFQFPTGIDGDSQYLYIVDSGNSRIIKTDLNLVKFTAFETDSDNPLDNPWGISLDGQSLSVSDTENHRIIKYNTLGIKLSEFGELGIFDGSFDEPKGLIMSAGSIRICDSRNNRIQSFDDDYFIESFGSWGHNKETLDEPWDIFSLSNENLLISDHRNKRLAVFNLSGQWVRDISPDFPKDTVGFGEIKGIGIDADNNIYVADPDNHRVIVLKENGIILSEISVKAPEDVYIWGNNVFITDQDSHSIIKFRKR
ncbi:hypothetical protein HOH45_01590 [bacterium]|jgi:tripartite motif-containing protein 71|nr:hypothetical protein [bacterium]